MEPRAKYDRRKEWPELEDLTSRTNLLSEDVNFLDTLQPGYWKGTKGFPCCLITLTKLESKESTPHRCFLYNYATAISFTARDSFMGMYIFHKAILINDANRICTFNQQVYIYHLL